MAAASSAARCSRLDIAPRDTGGMAEWQLVGVLAGTDYQPRAI